MPKCPYCQGIFGGSVFIGETVHIGFKNYAKMYVCPHCDTILGFSEYKWDDE